LRENEWSVLLLMRLVPVVPFFVANLIPAFVGVPLWRFAVTTFLGIMPGGLVYTSVGAGLGEVFAAGRDAGPGHHLRPACWADPGAGALSALPIVLKRFAEG
jgi:uncharacterized membrane protein YdjX (TVP38/TMEM64 family)